MSHPRHSFEGVRSPNPTNSCTYLVGVIPKTRMLAKVPEKTVLPPSRSSSTGRKKAFGPKSATPAVGRLSLYSAG